MLSRANSLLLSAKQFRKQVAALTVIQIASATKLKKALGGRFGLIGAGVPAVSRSPERRTASIVGRTFSASATHQTPPRVAENPGRHRRPNMQEAHKPAPDADSHPPRPSRIE